MFLVSLAMASIPLSLTTRGCIGLGVMILSRTKLSSLDHLDTMLGSVRLGKESVTCGRRRVFHVHSEMAEIKARGEGYIRSAIYIDTPLKQCSQGFCSASAWAGQFMAIGPE